MKKTELEIAEFVEVVKSYLRVLDTCGNLNLINAYNVIDEAKGYYIHIRHHKDKLEKLKDG